MENLLRLAKYLYQVICVDSRSGAALFCFAIRTACSIMVEKFLEKFQKNKTNRHQNRTYGVKGPFSSRQGGEQHG